jgi:hypothetical protein
MFFDTKQKVLFGIAVAVLLFAGVATVARLNSKPDPKALPVDIQRVFPLDKPTNIELLEDDAGIGK